MLHRICYCLFVKNSFIDLPDTFYIYVSLSVAHDNLVYDSVCFQYRVDI
jgi:hypothetical protein